MTTHHDCLFTADWMHDPWPFLLKASDPHFSGFDEEVEQNVEFDIQKAISEAKVAQSDALIPSLHQLINFVDALVLTFKPDLVPHTSATSPTVLN
ncbi:MAG: hypothetical protein ACRD2U_12195 [Terriglobales bacterium]